MNQDIVFGVFFLSPFFVNKIAKLTGFELCQLFIGEFDSGSERTLAAWIRHASRTIFLDLEAARPRDLIR
jgi:hypothetical protein